MPTTAKHETASALQARCPHLLAPAAAGFLGRCLCMTGTGGAGTPGPEALGHQLEITVPLSLAPGRLPRLSVQIRVAPTPGTPRHQNSTPVAHRLRILTRQCGACHSGTGPTTTSASSTAGSRWVKWTAPLASATLVRNVQQHLGARVAH
jgi:hypothetical protein